MQVMTRVRTKGAPGPLCFGLALAGMLIAGSATALPVTNVVPIIVAGSATAVPTDSPSKRIDPNTTTSLFAGVGWFQGVGGCSGSPIGMRFIVTAAHCVDSNADGLVDNRLRNLPSRAKFRLNFGGNLTHTLTAASFALAPGWTGFSNPNVNDDIVIVELSADLPAGVPIYDLFRDTLQVGSTLTHVGYGMSGYGTDSTYTVSANNKRKRVGGNVIDFVELDDEGGGLGEVFLFDFDDPAGLINRSGGGSLGNTIETVFGPGDSGGPAFIAIAGQILLAGIDTFTAQFINPDGSLGPRAPAFGSAGGGIMLGAYLDWIDGVLAGTIATSATGTFSGGSSGTSLAAVPAPAVTWPFALALVVLGAATRRLRTT